jgi:[ribosomal protein S5]-alanine N-acetyltransferase
MNAPSSKLRMPDLRLLTPRLELVAGTMQLAQAEISNLPSFAQLLDAPTPASWPPPSNDEHSQQYFLASLQKAEASDAGWNLWFCVRREPRELIGNAGFKGSPKDGLVEIGYSMLEIHQRQGYATEAVRALLSWAFQSPEVQRVVADTLPGLTPSIRVMEKSGFAFVGEGPVEDGMRTIRYELTRERFQALASQ